MLGVQAYRHHLKRGLVPSLSSWGFGLETPNVELHGSVSTCRFQPLATVFQALLLVLGFSVRHSLGKGSQGKNSRGRLGCRNKLEALVKVTNTSTGLAFMWVSF